MAKCVKSVVQPPPSSPPPVVEYRLTLTEEEAQVLCAIFGAAAPNGNGPQYSTMLDVHRAIQEQLGGWEARKYSLRTWAFNCGPRNA